MISGDALAQDLGISTTALSQIINGKGRYAVATRARVLARVRELGYVPHAGARAARLQRFDAIALFNSLTSWQGQLNPLLLDGCLAATTALGLRLVLESVGEDGVPGLAGRSSLFGQRLCDGLLMNHHLPPTPELRRLAEGCGVPVLWLNLRLPQACIHPDDEAAAAAVVEALVRRGRRRLAFVDFRHDHADPLAIAGAHYSVAARWQAAQRAAAAAGVPIALINRHQPEPAAQHAFLRQRLTAPDAPDALICYQPHDSMAALLALAALGREAGREVGVVQFADQPQVLLRPLATAIVPLRALGRAAVERLAAAIADRAHALPAIPVPFTYALTGSL